MSLLEILLPRADHRVQPIYSESKRNQRRYIIWTSHDGVSNQQQLDCLFNSLSRLASTSLAASTLRIIGLLWFPIQKERASYCGVFTNLQCDPLCREEEIECFDQQSPETDITCPKNLFQILSGEMLYLKLTYCNFMTYDKFHTKKTLHFRSNGGCYVIRFQDRDWLPFALVTFGGCQQVFLSILDYFYTCASPVRLP